MNKHLTGLVAVAAVVSVTASSIPAEAATNLEHAKSVITDFINDLTSGEITSEDYLEYECNNKIADTNLSTSVNMTTTSGAVTINVDILGTPEDADTVVGTTPPAVSTTSQAVTLDTLTFEKETTTQAAVTLVNNELKNISLDNNSTGYEVEKAIRVALDSAKLYGMEASVHNFAIVPAQGETLGSATGTILLTNYNDDARPTISIPFNLSVSKAETSGDDDYDKQHENLYNAMDVIEEAINKLNISNNTTEDEIKNAAQNALAQNNIPVTIGAFDFQKSDATETNIGYIYYKIELKDSTNNLEDYDENTIDIDTEATAKVRKSIKDYLDKLVPSNSMNEDDILDGVIKSVNDTDVKISIWDFYLKKATNIETNDSDGMGYCNFSIKVEDPNNKFYMYYSSDDFKSTGETGTPGNTGNSGNSGNSGSSSGSSSSHHSSGGSSSSSNSSSSSSSSNSNSTAATGTANSANGTASDSDSAKPVSLANMSKEAVKAVEAKVVNSISAVTGATAGEAKELVATDGAKLSVTPIAKDGKSVGAVITAEAASAKAVIPVDKNQAPVTAVYKYVPLLDKYIQVQNAVITTDAITLPVQANATYVASPTGMPEVATIKQGWVQANNNWYMVNATGDPLTEWQKDNTGWTYMSPSTGAMQTGWAQVGGSWVLPKE